MIKGNCLATLWSWVLILLGILERGASAKLTRSPFMSYNQERHPDVIISIAESKIQALLGDCKTPTLYTTTL